MYKKMYFFSSIIAVILINLVAACGSASSVDKSISSKDIPDVEQTKGYLTIQDGRLVEYSILIPLSWEDKYEIRKEGNIAYYDFFASPKQALFSIEALTLAQWQKMQQEPGHGEELFTQHEIVYVYRVALDNPYTDSQAVAFQQMAGQVKNVLSSLIVSMITNPDVMLEAEKALINFLDRLSKGEYTEAAALYGGSYEVLMDLNPVDDPDDHAVLLENACTINGFQCLPIKQVVRGRQEWPETYVFVLEFLNPDGSLFKLGSCCGETAENAEPQSQFEFTVQRTPQAGNIFLVQNLPVYVP